jgi:ABC-type glutathione transport system ATPase component
VDPGHAEDGPLELVRGLERRLDRLEARAERAVQEHADAGKALAATAEFLALAPSAAAHLEELTKKLFGELLDEVETNLTHAVREILGQDRTVTSVRQIKNNRLHVDFQMEQDGAVEDVLVGQGGSVCNILSTGLRLIALSQLDPARHRPFLVLDEQDCWLKPELVPKFMHLISKIARKLGLQVLVISHHPVDLFATHAQRIYGLKPSREHGVVLELLRDAAADEGAAAGAG